MSAPIVEDCTRQSRVCSPGSRWGIAADRTFDDAWSTEITLGDQIANGEEIPIPSAIMKYREEAARAIPGVNHRIGFGGGERHHLVDHAVPSCLEDLDGEPGMALM